MSEDRKFSDDCGPEGERCEVAIRWSALPETRLELCTIHLTAPQKVKHLEAQLKRAEDDLRNETAASVQQVRELEAELQRAFEDDAEIVANLTTRLTQVEAERDALAAILEGNYLSLEDQQKQREQGWPDIHPEHFCHKCGFRNLRCWFTPGPWPEQFDRENNGIVCPQCLGEAVGGTDRSKPYRTSWTITQEAIGGDSTMTDQEKKTRGEAALYEAYAHLSVDYIIEWAQARVSPLSPPDESTYGDDGRS